MFTSAKRRPRVASVAVLLSTLLLVVAAPVAAQQVRVGRPATPEEIARNNIDVRPDGQGLPSGGGTAQDGQPIFAAKCASCHGAAGEGTSSGPKLVDATPFQVGVNQPTIGNYWPYASTVWDYIHRAMPFDAPGSLSSDEVYALTAYLLASNGIVPEDQRI